MAECDCADEFQTLQREGFEDLLLSVDRVADPQRPQTKRGRLQTEVLDCGTEGEEVQTVPERVLLLQAEYEPVGSLDDLGRDSARAAEGRQV